jgi:uncharacterized RDD family membrane protein YckC
MAISTENRYAPPSATVADVAPESADLPLATRWRRLSGAILDGLVVGLASLPVGLLLGRNIFKPPAGSGLDFLAVNALIGVTLFFLINGWLLFNRGQTVAKALLGTRIVRPNGDKVGAGRIGLRYLASNGISMIPLVGALFALVDCLLIFRESRRCLHDQIADTIVIRI